MNATDLFIILAGLSLVVIAAVLVPAILQFRRTYAKAEGLIDSIGKELPPLCQRVTAAAGEVELLSASLAGKIEQTDKAFQALRQSADTLMLTSNLLKEAVRPVITNIGGITAGIKTFSHILFRSRD
ncbi:MAG: DUF948 domain-containing protein [Thermodesulfobacteriota bacterium]